MKENNWLKAVAIIMAVALVFTIVTSNIVSLTAISVLKKAKVGSIVQEGEPSDTTKTTEGDNAGPVDNPNTGDSTEDTTAAGTDSTTSGGSGSGTGNTNAAAFSKADAIKLINDATSKAVNNKAGYSWSKQSAYTGDGLVLGVPGFVVSGINAILGRLEYPTDIETVVGNFIGIGEKKGAVKKGTKEGKYSSGDTAFKDSEYLIGTQLTEADVTKFEKNGDKVTLYLTDCSEPIRDKKSSLSRLTNDFITKGDVVEGLASQDDVPATLNEDKSSVSFKTIIAEATIKDGKIVSLKYSYDWEANVSIKVATFTINGTGNAKTIINYTNFVY